MGGSSSKEEAEKKRIEEEEKWQKEEQKRRYEEALRRIGILAEQQRYEENERRRDAEQKRLAVERERLEEVRKQKQKEELRFLQKLNLGEITPNLLLINDLRTAFNLGGSLPQLPQAPYEETELDETSQEYLQIAILFKNSNKPNFTITRIVEINNPFHLIQYHLMKQRRICDEPNLKEVMMFHGTKKEFIYDICTYNFDRSKVKAHKFGHGTSFARDAYYATHYHMDNKRKMAKVMVVAKVFYGSLQEGNENTIIPEAPYYASANDNMTVIVKYDDASFVPLYVIHYEGLHPPKASSRNKSMMYY